MTDLTPLSDELSDLDTIDETAIRWLLDLKDIGERASSRLFERCASILSVARQCRDTHLYIPFHKAYHRTHEALVGTLFEGHGSIDTFEVYTERVTLNTISYGRHGDGDEHWKLSFPIAWLWMSYDDVKLLCNAELDVLATKECRKEDVVKAIREAAERAKLVELRAKYPDL
jgi:hypothetical protein